MTSVSVVKRSGQSLAKDVEAGQWERADRGLGYFVGAWQRARLRGADSTDVASFFDDLRMRVVTDHDVDQRPGPAQFAWMLAGVCSFLTQAATPSELVGADVESRILEALAADGEQLTTKDLAVRVERSVGATARALPQLRSQGLTTEAAAGRNVLNGITEAGRERSAQITAARRAREADERPWPTSLARTPYDQSVPMSPHDLVNAVVPNDVSVLRRARG